MSPKVFFGAYLNVQRILFSMIRTALRILTLVIPWIAAGRNQSIGQRSKTLMAKGLNNKIMIPQTIVTMMLVVLLSVTGCNQCPILKANSQNKNQNPLRKSLRKDVRTTKKFFTYDRSLTILNHWFRKERIQNMGYEMEDLIRGYTSYVPHYEIIDKTIHNQNGMMCLEPSNSLVAVHPCFPKIMDILQTWQKKDNLIKKIKGLNGHDYQITLERTDGMLYLATSIHLFRMLRTVDRKHSRYVWECEEVEKGIYSKMSHTQIIENDYLDGKSFTKCGKGQMGYFGSALITVKNLKTGTTTVLLI